MQIVEHFYKVLADDDFDILLMIGGYGSGKSFTGFSKVVLDSSKVKRKVLVIRKVFATHKESC